MLPILFKIGPIPIHSYGLMIALGFLGALFLIQRDAKKAGLDPQIFADGAFWTLPVGILGARLLHIFMFPESYSWSDPLGWIAIWEGGLVFQGGPPLAAAFVYFYMRRRGVGFLQVCDICLPYLALAHAFGRIGCFLNGCCYGVPSDVAWAIPFRRVPWDTSQPPTGSPVYLDHLHRFSDMSASDHWSHPVHPTQLYAVVGLLAIWGILLLLRNRWHPFVGFTVPGYLVLYGIFRFINEFYRGDHNPVHILGLSDQQVFSLVFAGAGVILFFVMRRHLPSTAGERA